jgi:hypothetical protein
MQKNSIRQNGSIAMSSVANKPFAQTVVVLNGIILDVVMLSVKAGLWCYFIVCYDRKLFMRQAQKNQYYRKNLLLPFSNNYL